MIFPFQSGEVKTINPKISMMIDSPCTKVILPSKKAAINKIIGVRLPITGITLVAKPTLRA